MRIRVDITYTPDRFCLNIFLFNYLFLGKYFPFCNLNSIGIILKYIVCVLFQHPIQKSILRRRCFRLQQIFTSELEYCPVASCICCCCHCLVFFCFLFSALQVHISFHHVCCCGIVYFSTCFRCP